MVWLAQNDDEWNVSGESPVLPNMMQRMRTWTAAAVLGVLAAAQFHGGSSSSPWVNAMVAVLALALLVAAVGVLKQRMWGRWLGLSAAVVGVTQFGVALSLGHLSRLPPGEMLLVASPIVLLLCLGGTGMAEHFTQHLRPQSVWRRHHDPRIKVLGAAIVASLAAAAMLSMFGVVHWNADVLFSTLAVAIAMTLGAGLAAAGRAAGVLLMGGGAALAGVCAVEMAAEATRLCAGRMTVMARYALPSVAFGAVMGSLGLVVCCAPMWRFLRAPVSAPAD